MPAGLNFLKMKDPLAVRCRARIEAYPQNDVRLFPVWVTEVSGLRRTVAIPAFGVPLLPLVERLGFFKASGPGVLNQRTVDDVFRGSPGMISASRMDFDGRPVARSPDRRVDRAVVVSMDAQIQADRFALVPGHIRRCTHRQGHQ